MFWIICTCEWNLVLNHVPWLKTNSLHKAGVLDSWFSYLVPPWLKGILYLPGNVVCAFYVRILVTQERSTCMYIIQFKAHSTTKKHQNVTAQDYLCIKIDYTPTICNQYTLWNEKNPPHLVGEQITGNPTCIPHSSNAFRAFPIRDKSAKVAKTMNSAFSLPATVKLGLFAVHQPRAEKHMHIQHNSVRWLAEAQRRAPFDWQIKQGVDRSLKLTWYLWSQNL